MSAKDRNQLEPHERRLLDEAVARGLMTGEAVAALIQKREIDEEGELQPISQLLLLERALAVPDYLALKRALATGEPARAPKGPASFGPYRVVREIARAPLTALFEAEDPQGRRVAIKAMLALTDASAAKRKRLETEVRALARLAHPGIARIHGAANEGGLPYFVMDLAPGTPLDRVLAEQGPFEPAAAAHVVADVALAVAHAHERGVLHRDLKPANVLWAGPGKPPVLVGFGLAKVLGLDARATLPGEVVGTPAYLPPEQARPSLGALGPTADVYGLGAILFELLAGRPPFVGKTVGEILTKVLDERPDPIEKVRQDVPPELASIVAKALEKSPADRPQRASELASLLKESVEGLPESPAPVEPTPSAPVSSEHPGLVRAAVWAALVLALELPLVAVTLGFEAKRARLERAGVALETEGARRLASAASYADALERARTLAPGDLERATVLLTAAASQRPDRPEAFARLADARARAGLGKLALADAKTARSLEGSLRDALDRSAIERAASLAEGRVALDVGDGASLEAIVRAGELGEPEAHALRARALVRSGQLDEAEKSVARAEQEHAPAGSVVRARAAILVARGEPERALGIVTLALDASPRDQDLLAALGEALAASGRRLEGIVALRELAALVPSHPAVALDLARELAAVEEWDAAVAAFEKAKKLGASDAALEHRLEVARGSALPESALDVAVRADYLLDLNRPVDAQALLASPLAQKPDAQSARALEHEKLRVLALAHDPAAVELARKLEGEKGPPRLLVSVAECYLGAGKLAEGARVCDRALELDRANLGALRLRGPLRARAAFREWTGAASFEAAARDLGEIVARLPAAVASGEIHHLLAAVDLSLLRTVEGTREVAAARAQGCSHTAELARLETALSLASPPATLSLSDTERLRIEAREIGDGEPWEVSADSLAAPVFGNACAFGRASLLLVATGQGRVAFSTLRPGSRARALDLGGASSLAAIVAVKGGAPELAAEVVVTDASGARRRLRSRRAVVGPKETWGELRVALSGDDVWESSGGSLDLAHVVRIEIAFAGAPGKPFAVWLDGLRAE